MTPIGTPPAPPWAAEHFQVKKYNTRYYTDRHLPACGIGEPSDDSFPGFSSVKPSKPFTKSIPWGEGKRTVPLDVFRVAEWLQTEPMFDASDPEHIMAMYRAVDEVRDRTFARGHAVHHIAECHLNCVKPEQWALDNVDARPYFQHVATWIQDNIARAIAMEAVIINRSSGYGGTGDLWAELVDGRIAYIDWKSRGEDSAHAIYDEEIGQGGAYNHPDAYMIVPSFDRQTAVRAPLPGATVGIVVSVRPDGVQAYEYDIAGAVATFEQMLVAYRAKSDMGKLARKAKIAAPPPPCVNTPVVESAGPTRPLAPVQPPTFDTPPPVSDVGTITPDEGNLYDNDAFDQLVTRYAAMPVADRAFTDRCKLEGNAADVPWWPAGKRTTRRYHLVAALIALGRDGDTHTINYLAPHVGVTTQPTPGHTIGLMDHMQAARFHQLCELWATTPVEYRISLFDPNQPSLFNGAA